MSNPAYDTAEQALEDIQGILVKVDKDMQTESYCDRPREVARIAFGVLTDIQERIDQWRNPA